MAARRIAMHRLEELVRLHRLGTPVHEVARLLKMGPRTERAYREALIDAGLLYGSTDDSLPALEELKSAVLARMPPPATPPHQVSTLESWRTEIEHLYDKACARVRSTTGCGSSARTSRERIRR